MNKKHLIVAIMADLASLLLALSLVVVFAVALASKANASRKMLIDEHYEIQSSGVERDDLFTGGLLAWHHYHETLHSKQDYRKRIQKYLNLAKEKPRYSFTHYTLALSEGCPIEEDKKTYPHLTKRIDEMFFHWDLAHKQRKDKELTEAENSILKAIDICLKMFDIVPVNDTTIGKVSIEAYQTKLLSLLENIKIMSQDCLKLYSEKPHVHELLFCENLDYEIDYITNFVQNSKFK